MAAMLDFFKNFKLIFVVSLQVSFMQKMKKIVLIDSSPRMPYVLTDGEWESDNLSKIAGKK